MEVSAGATMPACERVFINDIYPGFIICTIPVFPLLYDERVGPPRSKYSRIASA